MILSFVIVGRAFLSLAVVFVQNVVVATATLADNSTASSTKVGISDNNNNNCLCRVYMAPSTIPGAGMGMFAGHVDIERGEYLADGDLVIPAYDMTWQMGHSNYKFLWEEYTWRAGSFFGMKEEISDVSNVKACSPGFGAAVNCLLPLVNVKDDYSSRRVSFSGVNASSSPGAGAFTIYHGRRWKAERDIPAGMEFFGNYGQSYFMSRSEYGPIPLIADYKQVNNLLRNFRDIVREHKKKDVVKTSLQSANASTTLWDDWAIEFINMARNFSKIWDDSRTLNAIPKVDDLAVIDWLLEEGRGSGFQHYNTSIRSVEWLQEYGRCMDNIRDGVSNIPHAGRGAFAARFIAQGDIVAPAPLIQIPNRTVFTTYKPKTIKVRKKNGNFYRKLVPDHEKPLHSQLLLNYCFGHHDSTIILCPYGLLTSQINHDEHMAHPEWREQPIDSFEDEDHAGLSFDFVALRDIAPGEEITIDYGLEWSLAWKTHTHQFRKRDRYIPAYELNDRIDTVLHTLYERRIGKIGVRLFCREDHLKWAGILHIVETEIEKSKDVDWNEKRVYPCRILQRVNNFATTGVSTLMYTAEIFERSEKNAYESDPQSKWLPMSIETHLGVAFLLPSEAFYFADEIYQRPHHQPWSFRHDMRVPDHLFPDVWKNLANKETSS